MGQGGGAGQRGEEARRQFRLCNMVAQGKGEMPKEGFKGEVERHLTGQETEPWEIIYFKLYKSQLPIIEQALETASLMLGTQKSRGYCMEMICADFLAGATLDEASPAILSVSIRRLVELLPGPERLEFIRTLKESA